MREILFRGKSNWAYGNVKEGDWLYGMTISRHCYDDKEITSYYIGGGNKTIDGKTLGQYTGLIDKNGTKIFEGDICKHRSNYSGEYIISVVTYTDGQFLAMADNNSGFNLSDRLEVIGNIHDNPELLKGE